MCLLELLDGFVESIVLVIQHAQIVTELEIVGVAFHPLLGIFELKDVFLVFHFRSAIFIACRLQFGDLEFVLFETRGRGGAIDLRIGTAAQLLCRVQRLQGFFKTIVAHIQFGQTTAVVDVLRFFFDLGQTVGDQNIQILRGLDRLGFLFQARGFGGILHDVAIRACIGPALAHGVDGAGILVGLDELGVIRLEGEQDLEDLATFLRLIVIEV